MKKLFLAAVLLLSVTSNCSLSEYVNKARLGLGSVADLALGTGSINPEDEQLIKELQVKAGITGKIPVRNMSILAKLIFGFENGFAFAPGILNRLYLNKEWLSELTKEEKEFLFAHELMHVKHKDVFWAIFANFIKDFIDSKFAPKRTNDQINVQQPLDPQEAAARRRAQWLKDHAVKYATGAFKNTVSRSREKYADTDAVKLLKAGKGGVQLMRTWRKFKVQGPWYRKMHAILNKISYPVLSLPVLKQLFLSHPTFEDRMNYIAAEGFDQEQQTATENTTKNTVNPQSELSKVIE